MNVLNYEFSQLNTLQSPLSKKSALTIFAYADDTYLQLAIELAKIINPNVYIPPKCAILTNTLLAELIPDFTVLEEDVHKNNPRVRYLVSRLKEIQPICQYNSNSFALSGCRNILLNYIYYYVSQYQKRFPNSDKDTIYLLTPKKKTENVEIATDKEFEEMLKPKPNDSDFDLHKLKVIPTKDSKKFFKYIDGTQISLTSASTVSLIYDRLMQDISNKTAFRPSYDVSRADVGNHTVLKYVLSALLGSQDPNENKPIQRFLNEFKNGDVSLSKPIGNDGDSDNEANTLQDLIADKTNHIENLVFDEDFKILFKTFSLALIVRPSIFSSLQEKVYESVKKQGTLDLLGDRLKDIEDFMNAPTDKHKKFQKSFERDRKYNNWIFKSFTDLLSYLTKNLKMEEHEILLLNEKILSRTDLIDNCYSNTDLYNLLTTPHTKYKTLIFTNKEAVIVDSLDLKRDYNYLTSQDIRDLVSAKLMELPKVIAEKNALIDHKKNQQCDLAENINRIDSSIKSINDALNNRVCYGKPVDVLKTDLQLANIRKETLHKCYYRRKGETKQREITLVRKDGDLTFKYPIPSNNGVANDFKSMTWENFKYGYGCEEIILKEINKPIDEYERIKLTKALQGFEVDKKSEQALLDNFQSVTCQEISIDIYSRNREIYTNYKIANEIPTSPNATANCNNNLEIFNKLSKFFTPFHLKWCNYLKLKLGDAVNNSITTMLNSNLRYLQETYNPEGTTSDILLDNSDGSPLSVANLWKYATKNGNGAFIAVNYQKGYFIVLHSKFICSIPLWYGNLSVIDEDIKAYSINADALDKFLVINEKLLVSIAKNILNFITCNEAMSFGDLSTDLYSKTGIYLLSKGDALAVHNSLNVNSYRTIEYVNTKKEVTYNPNYSLLSDYVDVELEQ